jgi:hypothetical protein
MRLGAGLLEDIWMFFRLPDWLGYEIQHRWEQTAVDTRRWINAKPRLIMSVAGASVLVLVVTIGLLLPGKTVKVQEYKKGWFYDLNTGELFAAKADLIEPLYRLFRNPSPRSRKREGRVYRVNRRWC